MHLFYLNKFAFLLVFLGLCGTHVSLDSFQLFFLIIAHFFIFYYLRDLNAIHSFFFFFFPCHSISSPALFLFFMSFHFLPPPLIFLIIIIPLIIPFTFLPLFSISLLLEMNTWIGIRRKVSNKRYGKGKREG